MTVVHPVRRAALTGAALLGAFLLAGCGSGGQHGDDAGHAPPVASGPTAATPGGTFNDADVAFAQNMIAHHKQATEMADMAAKQAADPEIKKVAAQIKAAQDAEIKALTDWLTKWGKPLEPAGGHGSGHAMPGMMSSEEMSKLHGSKGVNFDRQWVRAMISHHNGAIQMAREEQQNGAYPEAKALATASEQSQAAEVDTLQKILDRL